MVLTWSYIRQLAWQHKKSLLLANLLAIFTTLCSVPIPLLLPLLVDEVLLHQEAQAVFVMQQILPSAWHGAIGYIFLMLGFTAVLRIASLLFSVGQSKLFAGLAKHIVFELRQKLLAKLERLSLMEYESLGTGSVTTHLVTDLDTIDKFVGETLSRFVIAMLTLLGTASILLWMNWKLAVLILIFNPIVVYATVLLGKRVKLLKKKENDSTARFTQGLTETLDAIQEIRASNRQGFFFSRLRGYAQDVRDKATASQWKTDISARSSGLLFQLGIDVFRAVAMLTVLFSDLSIGQMLAVFSYLWFMIGPVEQLLNLQYAFYAADGALSRINQLLARSVEPEYAEQQNPFLHRHSVSIEVKNLHFTYAQQPILQGLSFSIAQGEKVALVGASGGGKSTLVQLMLGLYSPESGSICYQNIDVTQIGFSQVREHVAVVLQHPSLFNDSLRANLCMGREVTDEQCWQALEIAQLKLTVEAMPQGLDSIIGRSGVRLSGGQRQRLAIARMVLANPHVVILDEATSALDASTEQGVHQALNAFLAQRTTLIIAHRLSAVKQADRIIVLDDGVVVEQGNHQTLLENQGLYQSLYGQLQA
ncbi:ABC transporter ATP-binding protein [Pseudomonas sp. F1_0610]|uniref:ABC transporter ATP-binding protein n=1 Tax=Pseudomonas sp. F1_0610 TaxID=3114284 RepID=UPI0039C41B17